MIFSISKIFNLTHNYLTANLKREAQKQNSMKRIIDFVGALKAEFPLHMTPELKKAFLEDAKTVISLTMNGAWANLAIHVINDLEKTIK